MFRPCRASSDAHKTFVPLSLPSPSSFPGGLFPNHQSQWLCQRLVLTEDKTSVSEAVILNLAEAVKVTVKAKVFVLAAGAIHTPQIMFNSGLRPKALGHYLCDHPMANCQVVLSPSILHEVRERYPEAVAQHAKEHPDDPVPIPLDDPPPQVSNYIKVMYRDHSVWKARPSLPLYIHHPQWDGESSAC